MIGEQTDNEIWTRFLFVSSFWMNQWPLGGKYHANMQILCYNPFSLSYITLHFLTYYTH